MVLFQSLWLILNFLNLFHCLVGCFSMIVSTPAVLSVLYACVLYFCICTCSAQLSMFHMERRSRSTLIIIFIMNPRCVIAVIINANIEMNHVMFAGI